MPSSFGYKRSWLAVKSADPFELLHQLNVRNLPVSTANWGGGLRYSDYHSWGATFICPAVGEWTFVVNPALRDLAHPETVDILRHLSSKFGEVHFYATHRVSSYGAWAKFIDGQAVRLFSIGEGADSVSEGQLTDLEARLIVERKEDLDEEEKVRLSESGFHQLLGDEDDVIAMAGLWSIDPQTLDELPETSELEPVMHYWRI